MGRICYKQGVCQKRLSLFCRQMRFEKNQENSLEHRQNRGHDLPKNEAPNLSQSSWLSSVLN